MRYLTPPADWLDNFGEVDQKARNNVLRYAVVGGDGSLSLTAGMTPDLAEVLRIGDGVVKGAYALEALRVLILADPALRPTRLYLARVAGVDSSAAGACTWIGAARAARLAGVRHFAPLADLIRATSLASAPFEGVIFPSKVAPALRQLGTSAKLLPAPATTEGVQSIAQAHPEDVALFSVEYLSNGVRKTHSLLAAASARGVHFLGRAGGRLVRSLAELESVHSGISRSVPAGQVLVIEHAHILWACDTPPGLSNAIGLEVRALLLPAPKATALAATPAGSSRVAPRQAAALAARY
jgi:hypothetical protein